METAFTDAHEAQLAQAVGFTLEDLEANRRGRISSHQSTWLVRDLRKQYWPSLIVWAVLGAIFGSLACLSLTSEQPQLKFVLIWCIAMALVLGRAGFLAYEFRQECQRLGKVKIDHTHFMLPQTWKPIYRLGRVQFEAKGKWFATDSALGSVLGPGRHYRIYYTPDVLSFPFGSAFTRSSPNAMKLPGGANRILSIEVLGYRE